MVNFTAINSISNWTTNTATKTKKWFNTYQSVIGQKIKRYTWTSLLMNEYMNLRGITGEGLQIKPDIVVAGIPVWNINRLGHAVSDEILKYRSMGGIFLAHQKGGKQTFKFTARIFGPMRFITYKLLEALQLLGSEDAKSVTDLTDIKTVTGVKLDWLMKDVIDPQGLIDAGSIGSDIIDYTKESEFSNEQYAFHRTFPIITETKIYTDMYLETLVCREDVKFGKNVLEVECAFRQYTAPLYYQKSEPQAEGKRKFYITFVPRNAMASIERIESVMNILWAGLMTFYLITGELQPDMMYQKPLGKDTWEGIGLLMTMIGHYAAARALYPNTLV